jgi:hypothetical protein
MQDRKITDQIIRHENAGLENDKPNYRVGECRTAKLKTK